MDIRSLRNRRSPQKSKVTVLPRQVSAVELYRLLRHPDEDLRLWASLAVLGLTVAGVAFFSSGAALLLVVFALWTVGALVRVNHRKHVGNALRIGRNQFPHLAVQAAHAACVLQAPPVQVFVYQDDKVFAYAFGWGSPQAVVASSELVEAMDESEFRFVVGHEMGHIALGHTRMSTLVGGVLGAPAVPLLSALFVPVFLWWSRSAEYSADRAGLLACGDLEKAISAMLKLLVGPRLAGFVNLDEILGQSQEVSAGLHARLGEAGSSHPYLVKRVRELARFWNSTECQEMLRVLASPQEPTLTHDRIAYPVVS